MVIRFYLGNNFKSCTQTNITWKNLALTISVLPSGKYWLVFSSTGKFKGNCEVWCNFWGFYSFVLGFLDATDAERLPLTFV